MSAIAVSVKPLKQVRGRPIYWRIPIKNPDNGSAINLTGATVTATLRSDSLRQPMTIGPLGADGVVLVTGTSAQSSKLVIDGGGDIISAIIGPRPASPTDHPATGNNRLILSVVDSQGAPFDFVWPVIGIDL